MKKKTLFLIICSILLAASISSGCKSKKKSKGCTQDSDCGPDRYCDQATRECRCSRDEACSPGEFCNEQGFCQESIGCFTNDDCETGQICNYQTNECVDSQCVTSIDCSFGKICSGGVCVDGCNSSGDCELGNICINGKCLTKADICGNDPNCIPCDDKSYCEFKQYCDQSTHKCYDATGPFCQPCDTLTPCPGYPQNACLKNPYNQGPDYYCGVDCSGGRECPNGFICYTIVTNPECTKNSDCPSGICNFLEGAISGTCQCVTDSDCNSLFTQASCVNGACIVGYNCAPEPGEYCP